MNDPSGFEQDLVRIFGQDKVDQFPEPLMGLMKAFHARATSRAELATRFELQDTNAWDGVWREVYNFGWEDALKGHHQVNERLNQLQEKIS